MAGDDRDGGAGREHAQARLERLHLTVAASRPFGEEDEAARFTDQAGRSSARACGPHRLRHMGNALSSKADAIEVTGVSKKTSPAATGKTRPQSRRGMAEAMANASR